MDDLQRALEAPLKMRMALGYLPPPPEDVTAQLEAWLVDATSAAAAPRARVRYAFATDPLFDTVVWRAGFAAAGLSGGLAARFEGVVSGEELARIDVALDQARPERVVDWIECRGGLVERGWRIGCELPFSRALALADPNPKVVALSEFAEASGIEVAHRFGRSAGLAGPSFTEVVGRLPGEGAAALEVGLAAYKALKAPRLPAQLVEAMRIGVRGPIALSVWLTGRALSRVGLVLAHPTTVDVLRLGQQLGATDMNPLAAVEGALGREGPSEAECAIAGNGPTVQLEYDL